MYIYESGEWGGGTSKRPPGGKGNCREDGDIEERWTPFKKTNKNKFGPPAG